MDTVRLKDAEYKKLISIMQESERLPVLQFAFFVFKVKAELGAALADKICDAAKNGEKLNVLIEDRN